MSKKLYVGNLLYEVTDEDLKNHFTQAGNVVSATVIRYRDTGRSKGFGFVEMETDEGAKQAIDTLNGQDFKGRKIVVAEARPQAPRRDFGGNNRRSNRNF
jgi:RNA recognition motif-containing protein